jgi:5'-phosphate synthase pdxT subunit
VSRVGLPGVPKAVGVLALQGDFAAHATTLRGLGAEVREVRRVAELQGLSGLVIPGGESTTLLHLMAAEPWFEAILALHREGGALFGTCAGAILLAREVLAPAQPSLGLLDMSVERNAFGRQVQSFETTLDFQGAPLRAAFIRAPRIRRVGPGVTVLARHAGEPVLVEQGKVMAATFHPEIAGEARVHERFLEAAARPHGMQESSAAGQPERETTT